MNASEKGDRLLCPLQQTPDFTCKRGSGQSCLSPFSFSIWIICAMPLLAHHSTAPYDMTRPSTVSGTITKFLWANPHSYIDLDVANDNGVEHWRLEIEAVNLLRRYGWTKDSLKAGDKISCIGARAKDPAVFAQKCFKVEFPDGRELMATPSGEPPEPSAPRRSDH